MTSKPLVNITNWFFYHYPDGELALCGQVEGHPRIEDGHRVITSAIWVKDDLICETENTKYILDNKPLKTIDSEWAVRLQYCGLSLNRVSYAH